MSHTSDTAPRVPLGVGALVSESFSILFGKFAPVLIVALVPTVLSLLVSGLLIGFGATIGLDQPDLAAPGAGFAFVLTTLAQIAFYSLTTALLVQLAYDAKLGRPIQIGWYISNSLGVIIPLSVLIIVAAIAAAIGFIFLIIPGLWVYAVFAMVAPVVVIERVGFGGLGRSAELTKEYRWPIIGALILMGICTAILSFFAAFVAGLLANAGVIVAMIAFLIPTALAAALTGILIALIYAKLREIKEGVNVDQIASVFD